MSKELTQETIGKLHDAPYPKDAIHIAVASLICIGNLKPGDHVILGDGGQKCYPVSWAEEGQKPIGIVDPFLTTPIESEQRCWVFLYPNTVTGLRLEWDHPAFKKEQDATDAAKARLTVIANALGISYDTLIHGTDNYGCDWGVGGDIYGDRTIPDDFWACMETVTGRKMKRPNGEAYFSCAC